MSQSDPDAAIRSWCALRCKNVAKRTDGRKMDIANRWEPSTVRHPELHSFFTEAGAWEFIADCLERGEKLQKLPKSEEFPDFTVVMLHAPDVGDRRIYMKLAMKLDLDIVVGVSFHYSTEEYRP